MLNAVKYANEAEVVDHMTYLSVCWEHLPRVYRKDRVLPAENGQETNLIWGKMLQYIRGIFMNNEVLNCCCFFLFFYILGGGVGGHVESKNILRCFMSWVVIMLNVMW